MPTVENVQRQVRRTEGFEVRFVYEGPGPRAGRDVRDDRTGIPGYPYERAAAGSTTVANWIDVRFKRSFSGFDVRVLDETGHAVNGRTKLPTLRATYNR